LCNRLINSTKLQEESISDEDRKRQRYIDEPEVIAPSVITLNAAAVSQAANDFLFYMTGLRDPAATSAYVRFQPQRRRVWFDEPRKSAECLECGNNPKSRLARGDTRRLPAIEKLKLLNCLDASCTNGVCSSHLPSYSCSTTPPPSRDRCG
jgi:hypothetical protein